MRRMLTWGSTGLVVAGLMAVTSAQAGKGPAAVEAHKAAAAKAAGQDFAYLKTSACSERQTPAAQTPAAA